jgi:predicted TIM-barrel fold metal-dependent hydrolase
MSASPDQGTPSTLLATVAVMSGSSRSVEEYVETLGLVDHHVHGCFRREGDERRFENALNEGNPTQLSDPSSAYDSQLGFAVRRWCAEPLGLPRHAPAEEYWRRRAELGEQEVGRRLTGAAGVTDWLVDNGFDRDNLLSGEELAATSGGRAYDVLRLELLAETLIAELDRPADLGDAVRAALAGRPESVVAAKSIIAYRGGFDRDLGRPSGQEVSTAAERWREQIDRGAPVRVTDPAILRWGIHAAVDERMPVQLHVGLGDRDLDLRTVNPLHLLPFLRDHEPTGVPILLLHCYPFEREAGYLAQAFETVHLDVGLAVNHLGVRGVSAVGRSLELAPFSKVLYSSDAAGPAELHYLGARLWREAVKRLVGGWVAHDDWSEDDARRVLRLVGRDNARRVYALD